MKSLPRHCPIFPWRIKPESRTAHTFRRFLVFAGFLIPLCGQLYAQQAAGGSTARHIAIGGDPLNPYLRDIMRAHTNPAQLAADSGVIWGDLGYLSTDLSNGGSRYQFLAASFALSDQFHAALILNKRESPLYAVDASTPSRDPIDEINGSVGSVLGFGTSAFGRPLSPMEVAGSYHSALIDVGGSVSYGGWKNERTDGDNLEQTVRTWRFKAGVIAPWGPDGLTADAALLVGLNSVEGTLTSAGQTSKLAMDGGTELGFDLRLEAVVRRHWMLIPRIRWYTFSWQMTQIRNGVTVVPDPVSEYTHNEFEVGIGGNYQFENVLIAGGISYQRILLENIYSSTGSTSKMTTTTNDLPKITLGTEIRLLSWLVARVGYFDRLATTETAVTTATVKTTTTVSSELPWYGDPNGLSAAQQRITLGIGVDVAGFQFDGTMGEGYFLNGPWPLSGTAQQMFGVVSMSFHF